MFTKNNTELQWRFTCDLRVFFSALLEERRRWWNSRISIYITPELHTTPGSGPRERFPTNICNYSYLRFWWISKMILYAYYYDTARILTTVFTNFQFNIRKTRARFRMNSSVLLLVVFSFFFCSQLWCFPLLSYRVPLCSLLCE